MSVAVSPGLKGSTIHRSRRRTWRSALEGYLCISPWLFGFFTLTLGPFLASLFMSFTDWPILASPRWVGLANFQRLLLVDKNFGTSMYNTAYYTFFSVPLGLVLAFFTALLLNQNVRGMPLYRTLFYVPSVTSGVATAILWSALFDARFGLINSALSAIGIRGPIWFGSRLWSKPALIFMSLWYVGGAVVIFLAGLQGISQHLYEAAEVDGADSRAKLRHITIPMMTPTIFFNLVMGIIGSFQVFTTAFVMTNGGPANSTLFIVLYLYRNAFTYFQMGYASAMAWMLFLVVLVFTGMQLAVSRRWVYYEEPAGGA
ncbi:MAG: carbohydrate ABC transporter permease [Anaerolineae bacterium]